MNMSENDKLTIEAIQKSNSIASACRYLGLQGKGGNYIRVKRVIEQYNVDTSHFTKVFYDTRRYGKKPLETHLVENSMYNSTKLRERLLKEGYKEHRCEKCGNTEWCGQPIPLELHHINGNHYDNRLENLLIVCSNCHSIEHRNGKLKKYTETKGISELDKIKELTDKGEISRNKKAEIAKKENKEKPKRYCANCGKELTPKQKVYCSQDCAHEYVSKRPSYLELTDKINEIGLNYTRLGEIYGVSASAVKKWCKIYKIV